MYNKDQKLSLYVIKIFIFDCEYLNIWIAAHFNSLKYLMFSSVRNL